jgi:AcrR family transcriptional regulator
MKNAAKKNSTTQPSKAAKRMSPPVKKVAKAPAKSPAKSGTKTTTKANVKRVTPLPATRVSAVKALPNKAKSAARAKPTPARGAKKKVAMPATPPVVTRRPRGRPSTREAMLDAAQTVVLEQGATRLTLDAVARQAGASKGGILYNFPTKQALLKALVERLVEHNRNAHAATTSTMPESPTRSLQAYVMNSVRAPDTDDKISGALLAALTAEPGLLKPVADYFGARFAQLTEELPLEHAAIVHLATEGLWILELLQISPFSPRQRSRVVEHLLRMADQGLPA